MKRMARESMARFRAVSIRLSSVARLGGLAAALCWATASAQSELVIYKEGTSLYHRAGCEVIRDMKGVVAMTRAQAEARGYRAHADCAPAAARPGAPPGPAAAPADPAKPK